MGKPQERATIYSVAKACGVSPATVSRVLSKSDYPVREEVRARVRAAAKELHYTPNLLGKYLKTNDSREIGVVVPNLSNHYYTTLLQGVQDYLIAQEYSIILCSSYRDPTIERKNIDLLVQKQVKGILMVSIDDNTKKLQQLIDRDYRFVLMEQDQQVSCNKVGFDFYQGGYIATEYLLQMGHRRIAFVGTRLDRHSRKELFRGYSTCLKRWEIPVDERLVVLSDRSEKESEAYFELNIGRAMAERILPMTDRPTACFCLNDMIAMGAASYFNQNGLQVPQDISVMGFDNIDFCSIFSPPLTTVDQSGYDLGKTSAKMLLDRIKGDDTPVNLNVRLEPKLCIRESVRAIVPDRD